MFANLAFVSSIKIRMSCKICSAVFEYEHETPKEYKLPNLEAIQEIANLYSGLKHKEPQSCQWVLKGTVDKFECLAAASPYYNKEISAENDMFRRAEVSRTSRNPPTWLTVEETLALSKNA